MSDFITVPIILPAASAASTDPDESSAGHQGFYKTLRCLQQDAYWVGMARDMENYCRECLKCQQMKQSLPSKVPLVSLPIGQLWEMIRYRSRQRLQNNVCCLRVLE